MSARSIRLRQTASLGLACAALIAANLGAAAAPRTPAVACNTAGPGKPQRTRLKALLQDLSAQRSFRLEYWATDDPEVVGAGGSEVELMTSLSEQANLIVRYAPSGPRCPGQWKIDTVWVLPLGKPAPPTALNPGPATPGADPATLQYLHAHGFAIPAAQGASAASAR